MALPVINLALNLHFQVQNCNLGHEFEHFRNESKDVCHQLYCCFYSKNTLKIPHHWLHRPTLAAHTCTVVVRMPVHSAPPVRAVAVQAWSVRRLLLVTGHGESRGLSLARHTCTHIASSRTVWIAQQFQCMGVSMSTHRLVQYTRRHAL